MRLRNAKRERGKVQKRRAVKVNGNGFESKKKHREHKRARDRKSERRGSADAFIQSACKKMCNDFGRRCVFDVLLFVLFLFQFLVHIEQFCACDVYTISSLCLFSLFQCLYMCVFYVVSSCSSYSI